MKTKKWLAPLVLIVVALMWAMYIGALSDPVKLSTQEMWNVPFFIILFLLVLQSLIKHEWFQFLGKRGLSGLGGFMQAFASFAGVGTTVLIPWALMTVFGLEIPYSLIAYLVLFWVSISGEVVFGNPDYDLPKNPPSSFSFAKIQELSEIPEQIRLVAIAIIDKMKDDYWRNFSAQLVTNWDNGRDLIPDGEHILNEMVSMELLKRKGKSYEVTKDFVKLFYRAKT